MFDTTKLHFIILLVTFSVFASCKKEKITYVNGVVVDATRSLSEISNATVYLQERKSDPTCFSCFAQTIATYNTDASGRFSFSFLGQDGYSYSVVASAQNYHSNIGTGDYNSLDKGQENNIEVELSPVAWLRLHLKNTTPFDASDEIDASNSFVTGAAAPLYGTTIDTIITGLVNGNSKVDAVWFVVKNGIPTNHSASIYCPRFDTTTYLIDY